jgi:hypothetical protein
MKTSEPAMNRRLSFILLSLFVVSTCLSQDDNTAVLSYYAVGNSLDGQPMVDMMNVLRFYPVFAMRDSVDAVNVTIYYGGNIYSREASHSQDRKYWEVLLPTFKLGEAIQRIEVEQSMKLDTKYSRRAQILDSLLRNSEDYTKQQSELLTKDWIQKTENFRSAFNDLNRRTQALGIRPGDRAELSKVLQDSGRLAFDARVQSMLQARNILRAFGPKGKKRISEKVDSIRQVVQEHTELYQWAESAHGQYSASLFEAKKKASDERFRISLLRDSLISDLAKEIEIGLTDTLLTGPSIRKSDIYVDSTFHRARVLYRNYKTSLRRMPALDPAERMGIFRIRYVPFPIVGTEESPRMSLKKPLMSGSPTVFEVGLAFGDAIVPGDEFVVPEFSWRRLGVAFAITEQLFSDRAEIIALALTYDFNSYGSIGLGGNFAKKAVHGYASLGINKKAFEGLLSKIASIF